MEGAGNRRLLEEGGGEAEGLEGLISVFQASHGG